jgi:hypothetical protein
MYIVQTTHMVVLVDCVLLLEKFHVAVPAIYGYVFGLIVVIDQLIRGLQQLVILTVPQDFKGKTNGI